MLRIGTITRVCCNASAVAQITSMYNGIPLPGLTNTSAIMSGPATNNDLSMSTSKPARFPGAKSNPFSTVGNWEMYMDKLDVVVDEPKETTSAFTRERNKDARYWKAGVKFVSGDYESTSIKMFACEVPYVSGSGYGQSYFYARLPRAIGDRIKETAISRDMSVKVTDDAKFKTSDNEWWCSVSISPESIGVLDRSGIFEPRPLTSIMEVTGQRGVLLNLDLEFSLKVSTDASKGRSPRDVFKIVPNATRAYIVDIDQDIPVPTLSGRRNAQAAPGDIASESLVNRLMDLKF